jgi:hypothetical protein
MMRDLPEAHARRRRGKIATTDMTALILNWPQVWEAGLLTCGGKGYHLAQLHRYGFPLPDGGVVMAGVYRQLMQAPALAALRQALVTLHAEDITDPMVQEQLAHMQQRVTAAVLPAVVNIPGLLNHIKDGEILAVDGAAATVRCMLPPTTIADHQG